MKASVPLNQQILFLPLALPFVGEGTSAHMLPSSQTATVSPSFLNLGQLLLWLLSGVECDASLNIQSVSQYCLFCTYHAPPVLSLEYIRIFLKTRVLLNFIFKIQSTYEIVLISGV